MLILLGPAFREHPFGETYNRESNIVKGEAVNMGMLSLLGRKEKKWKIW